MEATTAFKRSWLRAKYALVPTTHATLLVALTYANSAAVSASGGSSGAGTISSVSANGRTTTLQAPSQFTYSSSDLAETSGEMLDLYDSANAALIASGIASPTDAQLYAQMLAALKPAFEATVNFSGYDRCSS